ncbi:MAG: sulfotransferase domain-containing protein [Caldilineaceae bacterium]|nr:sulfotransferase domain-containing protein [Caldilineaceae bacterium]
MFKQWVWPFQRETKGGGASVVIVSGLPRSGTSMMMKMLEAGGLPVLVDHVRTADADNPQGYYEYELVKQLDKGNHAWLAQAQGKGVKVISALLPHLPGAYHYKVIFMQREMAEVLASQQKMLERRGETDVVDDRVMAQMFEEHLAQVRGWLQNQPNIELLDVHYNQLVADPHPAVRLINGFFDQTLIEAQMLAAIDPALYRNRQ